MAYITTLTAFVLLLATAGRANAYIDAGSGSYVLQMMLAGVLALAFSIKMYWQKLRANLSGLFGGSRQTEVRRGE